MAEDPNVALVMDRWNDADKALLQERRHYWLNRSFYLGHQWVRWDTASRLVQSTVATTVYEDERMKVTVNKIQSRVNLLKGRLCQRNLQFEGVPTDSDDATIGKSKTAEAVVESARKDLGWEDVRGQAVLSTLLGGTGAVCLEWDKSAGQQLLQDSGSGQVVGTGEVKLRALSIAEFSLETGVRERADARWWVCCTGVPPEQVKAQFNLDWTPQPDTQAGTSPLRRPMFSALEWEEQADLTAVYVLYERPHPQCEQGRHIVVVNGQVVVNEDWPFPFKELNLYPFRALELDGQWPGATMVSAARPLQVLYNIARSGLAEHMKLASNARLLIPKGALDADTELTDEPGEPVEYWAEQGVPPPQWLSPPALQRWYTQEADRLEVEIDDIMHSHAVSRGEAPGDRNSGLALSILSEKNDTPLGPMSRDQANGWAKIAELALQLYADRATEKRVVITVGRSGVPSKQEWSGDKIGDQWRMSVPMDTVMPTSKIATQAMLTSLMQAFPQLAGAMSAEQLVKVLELPGAKALSELADSDINRARYENERMATGQVEIPEKWHDHAKHIAEHNDYRNSTAYDALPEDVKQIFTSHNAAHQWFVLEQAADQAELNAHAPGLGGLPQADNPPGSAVPEPHALASQKQAAALAAPNGSQPI